MLALVQQLHLLLLPCARCLFGSAAASAAVLQVYAFSLENWQRDRSEVTFLMNLFQSALQQQLPELQRNGVRLHFMGQLELLPPGLQQQIAACSAATAGNSGLLLNVAVSYSAQHDMVGAVQRLAQRVQEGSLAPEQASGVEPHCSCSIEAVELLYRNLPCVHFIVCITMQLQCCLPQFEAVSQQCSPRCAAPCPAVWLLICYADNARADIAGAVIGSRHCSSGPARPADPHQRRAAAEQLHAV